MRDLRRTVTVALGLVVLTGCGRRQPPAEPAPAQQQPVVRDDGAAREAAERAAREAAEAARREAEAARATLQAMVFFDYDQADLRDDARRALDEKLPLLRQDGSIRLLVQGHADERGSTEYNMALGMRRAMTVVSYLAGYGIEASRFQTVSYGEERPRSQGQGESAWAQNRRAEFQITAGGPLAGSR